MNVAIQHPDQIGVKTIDAIHDYFAGKKPPAKIAVPVGTYTKSDAKYRPQGRFFCA